MRPSYWLIIALSVLLLSPAIAGCIDSAQDQEDGNDETPEPEAVSLDWWVSDCQAVVAVIPVDAEALSAHLPEGFSPISAEDAFGLPADPRGEGALALETFHCSSGSGLDGEIEDLAYGAIFAPVTAPENLTDPEADITFHKWETLVQDTPLRDLMQEHGLHAVDGTTDLSGFEQTPVGHIFDVSLQLGGASFRFTGSAATPNEGFRQGFHFQELWEGTDGFGQWISYENEAKEGNSGSGFVQLEPDHWTSDIVGAAYTQAYIVASPEVHFTDGEIILPLSR